MLVSFFKMHLVFMVDDCILRSTPILSRYGDCYDLEIGVICLVSVCSSMINNNRRRGPDLDSLLSGMNFEHVLS